MIETIEHQPIIAVCVLFGASLIFIIIAMLTAPNDEDDNDNPKFI